VAKHKATNAADALLAGQNGGERFKTNAEYLAFLGRHPIAGEQMPPLKRAKYPTEREQQQQIIHEKVLQREEARLAAHQRNHQVGGSSSSSSQHPIPPPPPPPPLPCVQQGGDSPSSLGFVAWDYTRVDRFWDGSSKRSKNLWRNAGPDQ